MENIKDSAKKPDDRESIGQICSHSAVGSWRKTRRSHRLRRLSSELSEHSSKDLKKPFDSNHRYGHADAVLTNDFVHQGDEQHQLDQAKTWQEHSHPHSDLIDIANHFTSPDTNHSSNQSNLTTLDNSFDSSAPRPPSVQQFDFDRSSNEGSDSDTVEMDNSSSSELKRLFAQIIFFTFCVIVSQAVRNSFSGTTQLHLPSNSHVKDDKYTVYQETKAAQPFFKVGGAAYDSYKGNLNVVWDSMNEFGFVFVMYYAEWSASSMYARDEFELAAKVMFKKVPFIAVNCWHESSHCRQKYKFYHYPGFYVYVSGMKQGFYYSGVPKAFYFVRFIQSLLNPMTYIHDAPQLLNFISRQDSSLVGYFNLSQPEPQREYEQFYFASLRSIEKDFVQPVRFGVLSDRQFASQFEIGDANPLMLVRSTALNIPFPPTNNFTTSSIVQWVDDNKIEPLVNWQFPSKSKSTQLHTVLSSGPTLVLFTTFKPCSQYNNAASLMRELALSYRICDNVTEAMESKIHAHIELSIANRQRKQTDLCPKCLPDYPTSVKQTVELDDNKGNCCFSVNTTLFRSHRICEVCMNEIACGGCGLSEAGLMRLLPGNSKLDYQCLASKTTYCPHRKTEICCVASNSSSAFQPLPLRRQTDEFVTANSVKLCKPANCSTSDDDRIQCFTDLRFYRNGSLCMLNRTINFVAIDKTLYSGYASRLGVNLNYRNTEVVMFDLDNEAHYHMNADFTKHNIVNFLESFSKGNLQRKLLNSQSNESLNTQHKSGRVKPTLDVSGWQLQAMLAKRNKDLVVLFHTKACGLCKSMYHIYMNVAYRLRMASNIKFLRVDVLNNMLPWKYTVTSIPAVIIFPRDGDSMTYPAEHLYSIAALTQFILRYSSMEVAFSIAAKKPSSKTKAYIEFCKHKLKAQISRLEAKLNDEDDFSTNKTSLMKVRKIKTLQYLNIWKVERLLFKSAGNPQFSQSIWRLKYYRNLIRKMNAIIL